MVPPFLWKILTQLKGCRDARFLSKIQGFKTVDYPHRLSNLELNSLYLRRIFSDLILYFFTKYLLHGLTLCNIYKHVNFRISSSTRGHTYKLDYHRVSDNMKLMCRIVNYWNSLPITALECISTDSFRNCVCRLIPDRLIYHSLITLIVDYMLIWNEILWSMSMML